MTAITLNKNGDAARLARSFTAVLREWLTKAEMKEVVRRNKANAERFPNCCASHDFCDANMAMDEAFRRTFNRELLPDDAEGMSDADCDLFNFAWDLAKTAQFDADKI